MYGCKARVHINEVNGVKEIKLVDNNHEHLVKRKRIQKKVQKNNVKIEKKTDCSK
jgi:hypothetical protein